MRHELLHLTDYFPELGGNGKDPTLTLYIPHNIPEMNCPNLKRPSILLCPGGGYGFVSGREWEPIALNFLPHGYNVFVLNYSVQPNRFPTQLREVAAAMELIHSNAQAWCTDEKRIAIMGFSAGGHLAGHYSTCYDCPEVREMFPDSKPVQASVLCYPVITADPRKTHLGTFQNLSGKAEMSDDEIEKYSLEKRVSDRTPPAFLWHTFCDQAVPVVNSLLYAQALAEHHVPFALHIYPVGQHGLATVDEQTCGVLDYATSHAHDWFEAALKWLKITL